MHTAPTPSALENASQLLSTVRRPWRTCLPAVRILGSGVAVAVGATGMLILTASAA